jgi:hypothetical protein
VLLTIVFVLGLALAGCTSGDDADDASTDATDSAFTGSATAELVFGTEVYTFDVVCQIAGSEEDGRLMLAGPAAPGSRGIGVEASIAIDGGDGRASANLGGEPVRRVELAETDFDRQGNGWSTSGSFEELDRGSSTEGQLTIDGCIPP